MGLQGIDTWIYPSRACRARKNLVKLLAYDLTANKVAKATVSPYFGGALAPAFA